jgi:hypothetical protein
MRSPEEEDGERPLWTAWPAADCCLGPAVTPRPRLRLRAVWPRRATKVLELQRGAWALDAEPRRLLRSTLTWARQTTAHTCRFRSRSSSATFGHLCSPIILLATRQLGHFAPSRWIRRHSAASRVLPGSSRGFETRPPLQNEHGALRQTPAMGPRAGTQWGAQGCRRVERRGERLSPSGPASAAEHQGWKGGAGEPVHSPAPHRSGRAGDYRQPVISSTTPLPVMLCWMLT